jgi:hypothetical protein
LLSKGITVLEAIFQDRKVEKAKRVNNLVEEIKISLQLKGSKYQQLRRDPASKKLG